MPTKASRNSCPTRCMSRVCASAGSFSASMPAPRQKACRPLCTSIESRRARRRWLGILAGGLGQAGDAPGDDFFVGLGSCDLRPVVGGDARHGLAVGVHRPEAAALAADVSSSEPLVGIAGT